MEVLETEIEQVKSQIGGSLESLKRECNTAAENVHRGIDKLEEMESKG